MNLKLFCPLSLVSKLTNYRAKTKQLGKRQIYLLSQRRNLINLVSVALIINQIATCAHLINCAPNLTATITETINNSNETSAAVRLVESNVKFADRSESTTNNNAGSLRSNSSKVITSTDPVNVLSQTNDQDGYSSGRQEDEKKTARLQTMIAANSNRSSTSQLLSMRENGGAIVSSNQEPVLKKRETSFEKQRAIPVYAKDQFDDTVEVQAERAFGDLFKKQPYSRYWSAEQKWDSVFTRALEIQRVMTMLMTKTMLKDAEYYADVSISEPCKADIKYIQAYNKAKPSNFRWLMHMIDSVGKDQPGMLSGNFANLGHVVECIRVRAPAKPTNETFEDRFFDLQTAKLGEKFRGKYCLVSMRPVLPEKPYLISRFSEGTLNLEIVSNISYLGEPEATLRRRRNQYQTPEPLDPNERRKIRMDQVPFESELYQYLIDQRNFMYSMPRVMGVCYPASCSDEDIKTSVQNVVDESHQVIDIEFDCEIEERSFWDYYITPRLVSTVLLTLVTLITLIASVTRHILVDRLRVRLSKLEPTSPMANLLSMLEVLSMDKCAGLLFVKTRRATTIVDEEKPENNRSTSIDALRGFLVLALIYSQLAVLGCLPLPFMWADWLTAMVPFYRSLVTQPVINMSIWTEAFFIISAYLVAVKVLENGRPKINGVDLNGQTSRPLNLSSFVLKRYVRLVIPVLAFILLNYVWPRLSYGYVMQDQAKKILEPCDKNGWTNLLLFHNHDTMNNTCLWPSHVSASFFQLHLLSFPIISFLLVSFNKNLDSMRYKCFVHNIALYASWFLIILFSVVGLVYPALMAANEDIIVPFLIDYIDFDNYRRVIEWTVLPTYNHLTSYMVGIGVAYFVVRRRAKRDSRRASIFSSDLGGTYIHREGSFESAQSSSTQGLNIRIPSRVTDATLMTPSYGYHREQDTSTTFGADLLCAGKSCLAFLVLNISISASFFWNGLSQPMTPSQTFFYVVTTKLCFCLAFAYLFYKHFATRRNSRDPWMITRFLVPIGRMSLTIFYMSWLVTWFDLLASLYQWHPSHYFIMEKFSEIIFITAILSMIVYGASEGPIMAIRYVRRKVAHKSTNQNVPVEEMVGFASMFIPDDSDIANQTSTNDNVRMGVHQTMSPNVKASSKSLGNEMFTKGSSNTRQNLTEIQPSSTHQQTLVSSHGKLGRYLYNNQGVESDKGDDNGKHQRAGGATSLARLSIADQYKLNAELRANYSFASIGLYESAGATGDLEATGDPQTSPSSSHKHR